MPDRETPDPTAPGPFSYELGPIRPPSEAGSLLLRLTRNCPWNRCAFCTTYRGEKYGRRKAEEVLRDVATARAAVEEVRSFSRGAGEAGEIGEATLAGLRRLWPLSGVHGNVANFLRNGGLTVFLQDADPLAGPLDETARVLRAVRETFPSVERVTTYCRSKTAARLGADNFRALKAAGLDRVHTGMESGSDAVLALVRKGSSAEDHIRGGRAVKDAGLELSEYWIPGLGGRALTEEHSRASAATINAIRPDFVRLRTLAVTRSADLFAEVEAGRFERIGEDGTVLEIRDLVNRLDAPLRLESDHVLNLLEEVRGDLPADREAVLALIDGYLALPEPERIRYCIGRRLGAFRRLRDLHGQMRPRVDKAVERLGLKTMAEADGIVAEMMTGFV